MMAAMKNCYDRTKIPINRSKCRKFIKNSLIFNVKKLNFYG